MVKFSAFSTLVGLAASQSTVDPTVSLSATDVQVTFTLDATAYVGWATSGELVSLSGGSCTQISPDVTFAVTDDGNGNGQYTLDLVIANCGLVVGSNVTFQIGGTAATADVVNPAGGDVTLTFFEYQFTLDEEYTYQIRYSYGKVTTNTTILSPTDPGLDFHLIGYDETFTTEHNISDRMAGDMIYLGLKVADGIVFDHDAYNFALNYCKIRKVTGSVEYTFFDHARDSCANDLINLNMGYDNTVEMWQFSHMLFLLNGQHGDELEIICEVKVCPSGLHGTTCESIARECLACKASPCANAAETCTPTQDFSSGTCACAPIVDESQPALLQTPLATSGANCDIVDPCPLAGDSICASTGSILGTGPNCDSSCHDDAGTPCGFPSLTINLSGVDWTTAGYNCVA